MTADSRTETLTRPDPYWLFTDQRHGTADQYRRWLADAIQRPLFY